MQMEEEARRLRLENAELAARSAPAPSACVSAQSLLGCPESTLTLYMPESNAIMVPQERHLGAHAASTRGDPLHCLFWGILN